MVIAEVIGLISTIFWLLPPFRQYKSQYFLYFLVLALSDPVALLCMEVLRWSPNMIYPFTGLILFYTIGFSFLNIRRLWIIHLSLILAFTLSLFYVDNILYVVLALHFLILFKFVRSILFMIFNNKLFNTFYLALSFYELSIVVNLSVFLSGSNLHIVMYYITLAFQILLAIFFTIFTEKSKFLIIPLRSVD